MANSDKNILITPNTGSSTLSPTIVFRGANNTPVTLRTLDTGTISFEGTAGQLFSISDGLSGSIFSVNDISGIPSIEVLDTGLIKLNQYSGSTAFGSSAAIQNSSSVNAKVSISTVFPATPGLIIKSAASQTANLQEWQNSTGTVLALITPLGGITVSSDITQYGSGRTFIGGAADAGAFLNVGIPTASRQGIVVRANASQTANLQEWQNSAGTVLSRIDGAGSLISETVRASVLRAGNWASLPSGTVASFSTCTTASTVGFIVKAAASQTANLQEWQNSAGTVLASVNAYGGLVLSNAPLQTTYIQPIYGGNGSLIEMAYNYTTTIRSNGLTTVVPLTVKAVASQTANLQEWQNSSGTVLAKVDSAGAVIVGAGRVQLNGNNSASYFADGISSDGNYAGGGTVRGTSGGIFGGTTQLSSAGLTVYAPAAGNPGAIIRGAASQTADLQQWQNSSGSVLLNVDSTGSLDIGAGSNNIWKIKNQTSTVMEWQPGQGFCFFPYGSSNKPLTIKGTVSQSANLTEWRNSAETVIASISPTGKLTSAVDASINGVVIGMGAGSASSNTSVGLNSLVSNTTGTYNTAFGNQSLQLNTSGTQNTAFGQNALYNNRTGWYNTAFGQGALQNNNYAYSNTAIGTAAMINNISGSGNTAVGIQSLLLNSSGGNNVGIGQNAGFSNSTGSGNIFLGSEAGYYETGSNKLYIANTNTTTPLIGGDFSAKTLTVAGNTTITSQATGTVGLIVKAIASQSANLQEWQNSAGTVVASMRGDGLFNSYWGYHTYLQPQSGIGAYINLTNNGIIIAGYTNVADKILVVKGMSGQTGNLQEWQNSSGTVLANVTSSGAFFAQSLSSSSTGYQGNISSNDGTKGNLNFNTSGYGLLVTSAQTSAVVLTARGAASQTGNLQEWQDSTGAVGFRVNASPQTIGFNAATTARIQVGSVDTMTYNASTGWAFTPYDSSKIVLTVKAATSQTANLQEWQNSSGTLLSAIDKAGNLTKGDGDQLVLASQIFG